MRLILTITDDRVHYTCPDCKTEGAAEVTASSPHRMPVYERALRMLDEHGQSCPSRENVWLGGVTKGSPR